MSTPYLIGLTGGIGSGKSTVAQELEKLGAKVVSGDELGRMALEDFPDSLAQVRARFGDDVFDMNGNLLRRALGQRVFADTDDARWLTGMTFPIIHRLWREAVEHSHHDVMVLDAALIFEWGIEKEFDLILVVQADRDQIVSRMMSSGRLSRSEIEARLATQISPDIKAQKADVVLVNDGKPDEFRSRIQDFWKAQVVPELQHRRARKNGS